MRCPSVYLVCGLAASLAAWHSAEAQAIAPAAAEGCDPYQNYACFDTYVNQNGDDVFDRMASYYKLEWGQAGPPADPHAPPVRRDGWPATPQTSPPMPFTEWPYGGSQNLGVTRPASIDSPLMVGIANTWLGKAWAAENIQLYGWIDPGFNLSTSTAHLGGNAPAAYEYNPNSLNLDQAVLYFERVPDTVQSDHVDWGFRASVIYGSNYRYTTAYGVESEQFLTHNNVNGIDYPMMYGEIFIPQVGEGLILRLGRYVSLPDIEAQLAPNNYMYSHSITYTLDNYTNTGLQSTVALTQTFFLQLGVSDGTEAAPWHLGNHIQNPTQYVSYYDSASSSYVNGVLNPLYPSATFKKDPGAQPTGTACFRYQTQDGRNNINGCANAINKGTWGYNNLQWYGFTAYHSFNDHWHIAYEFYTEHANHVPNLNNPVVQGLNNSPYIGGSSGSPGPGGVPGGTPGVQYGYGTDGGTMFSSLQGIFANNPGEAKCDSSTPLTCTAVSYGTTSYINYSPNALNNFSIRPEFYWDRQGQRTGNKTRYADFGIGWQHWLSPQIELRPEVTYYRSYNGAAFNGNATQAPNKAAETILAADAIIHF